jgi:hypothetical protein
MTPRPATIGDVQHEIGPDGRLAVRVRSGDVRIRGISGGTVRVAARDGSSGAALDIDHADGSLTVRAGDAFGPGSHGGSLDLDIDVPAGAAVRIETASGEIRADGLTGVQRYRTASGDMELRAVHGDIAIEAVSGDVDLAADGPTQLSARTVSGDIDLRAGQVSIARIGTTSGDIRLAAHLDGDGPFAIETVSGDVTLAAADGVRVEGVSITGSLGSDRPSRLEERPGQRTLIVGDGGPTVTFRSTSGDLRVVRAAALPPVPPQPLAPPRAPAVPTPPEASAEPSTARVPVTSEAADGERLVILRDLERGDIDVTEASHRLAALDDSDPEADHAG